VTETAVPILPSRDLQETPALDALLGFERRGAPPETWSYLILGRGDIELHFRHDPHVDPLATDASCYLRVPDATTLYDEWARSGFEPDPTTGSRLVPPEDTAWGMREFALVDRSGNLLRVGWPL
jgi:hypothetical protein